MILLIGAGLIGTEFVKRISKSKVIYCIDPFKKNIKSSDIKYDNYRHFNCDFKEFLKFKEFHNKFNSIVNLSYPVKRDTNSEIFPSSNIFRDSINAHIGLYYDVMKYSETLLDKVEGGTVVSSSSIYSKFIPRDDIYKNNNRKTPSDYVASKSAIIYLSKYFAKKYNKNIYFNTISFGGVFNNHEDQFVKNYGKYTSSGKMLDVNQVVNSIIYLSEGKKNGLNGTNLVVDDGFTL